MERALSVLSNELLYCGAAYCADTIDGFVLFAYVLDIY